MHRRCLAELASVTVPASASAAEIFSPAVTNSIAATYRGQDVLAGETRLRELLLLGLDGDQAAYHRFLQALGTHLRAYFRRRLASLPDEVEDLVQETLLAVHNQRHTYDPLQPLTAWAHAIARYKMIDLLRRRGVHEARNVPLEEEHELFATADAEAGNARRDVLQLLERLPPNLRLPIQHMKLEGLSVVETARLTGMSESAVKVSVHRGLKTLAAMIRGKVEDR
jgi:RNA polymerase sigma-70 factor (ECF subfamily)